MTMQQRFAVKHFANKALIAAAVLLLFSSLSCGKRKPPLPPQEKVVQRAVVSGFQRGNQVIISWKMPLRNAPKGDVTRIERADVYRLAEPLNAPQALSEEEFAARSLIISTLKIGDDDFGGKTLQFTDTLQFAGQPARLRYAVRFVNGSGQKASFSNFLLVEPAASVSGPPTSLSSTVSQDEIKLKWDRPAANVDGSAPANILGFNIYRSESETVPAKLLNTSPITDEEYSDRYFEFEKRYFYFVRALSLGTDAQPVESSESNIIDINPVDTFPPSPPAAVTIAATPTTISIFFPVNPETDVVGYRVYRSTDRDLPMGDWELMTKEILTANTFQDEAVETGKTYYYYVTAIDKFKNVSLPSEVVSETVP